MEVYVVANYPAGQSLISYLFLDESWKTVLALIVLEFLYTVFICNCIHPMHSCVLQHTFSSASSVSSSLRPLLSLLLPLILNSPPHPHCHAYAFLCCNVATRVCDCLGVTSSPGSLSGEVGNYGYIACKRGAVIYQNRRV